MKKIALLVGIILIVLVSNSVWAKCIEPSQKILINVPKEHKLISEAVQFAKNKYPKNRNSDSELKVTINVEYGIYDKETRTNPATGKNEKGLLLDRGCTDVIGIPKDNKKPVIKRKDFTGFEQAVVKLRQSDVRLEGFEITADNECESYGILALIADFDDDIKSDLVNIRIINNTIRDIGKEGCSNSHGIVIWSEKSQKISNIEIIKNTLYALRLGDSEAITIKNNVDKFKVIENVIHNVDNIGIDIIGSEDNSEYQARDGEVRNNTVYNLQKGNSAYPHIAAIYVDGGKDTVISDNEVYGFGFGIELASEAYKKSVSNITVEKNRIHDNLVAGIGIGHSLNLDEEEKKVDGDQRSYVFDCKIIDNTVWNNGIGRSKENKIFDDGQIYLVNQLPGSLKNINIENNFIYITNKTVSHLISWDNCLWGDPWEKNDKKTSCVDECRGADESKEKKTQCQKECYKKYYENLRCSPQKGSKLAVRFVKNTFRSYDFSKVWQFVGDKEFGNNTDLGSNEPELMKYFLDVVSNRFEKNLDLQ